VSYDAFLEQLAALQAGYRAVQQQQGATADDFWRVLRDWDRVQMFWFVPLRSMWKVTYHWCAGQRTGVPSCVLHPGRLNRMHAGLACRAGGLI
jgi:hypothetical protein